MKILLALLLATLTTICRADTLPEPTLTDIQFRACGGGLCIVAQSEGLVTKAGVGQEVCFHRKMVLMRMIHFRDAGMGIHNFVAENPLPDFWTDEMKEEAGGVMVYIWQHDHAANIEYAHQSYTSCLAAHR